MTNTASNYDVTTMSSRYGEKWAVYDRRTGARVAHGTAANLTDRDAAITKAVAR